MSEHAKNVPAFYPGGHLAEAERDRVDNLALPLEALTVDHIVYSLGRFVETSFANTYLAASDVVGREAALAIAREVGRRHGGAGYAKVLVAEGRPGRGSPELMARYQDLAHAIRGPKHARALYAQVSGREVIVTKDECGYYDADRPAVAPFVEAFESGAFEGYLAADQNLERIEVVTCRWRGDQGCLVRLTWRDDRPD